jgi:phosphate transport system substrate-binding protein
MRTKLSLFLILFTLMVSCRQATTREERPLPSHNGPIRISGAYALYPLMQLWVAEFQKTHPYVKFEVQPLGTGRGLNEVLAGKTDLAMVSSEIPGRSKLDSTIWIIPVARLGVVPVMNLKNPYLETIRKKGIRRDDLIEMFSDQNGKKWGDYFGKPGSDKVNTYIRSDSSGASEVLAKYLWIRSSDFKGTPVDGEPKMIEAVKKDPSALGYCNFIYTFDPRTMQWLDGMAVIPIDFNQNGQIDEKEDIFDSVSHLQRAMWLGKFPCALTRNLYLASKGKPASKEVVEFLSWIVTDGQNLVPGAGYIELHTSEIQYLINALKN